MPAMSLLPDGSVDRDASPLTTAAVHEASVVPTGTPAIDPHKKAVVVAMGSLFGFCRFAQDFNDKNMGLIDMMKQSGCDIVLMYGNDSWEETARMTAHAVHIDHIAQNPIYARPEYNFADIPRLIGVDPKNTLFITAGDANIERLKEEKLMVCNASVCIPHSLINSDDVPDVADSRANFRKIEDALKLFVG